MPEYRVVYLATTHAADLKAGVLLCKPSMWFRTFREESSIATHDNVNCKSCIKKLDKINEAKPSS